MSAVAARDKEGRAGGLRAWLLIGTLFLCTLLVQGTALGGIVMFDDRVLATLGVTRGAFKFRDLIYLLATSFSCLVMATLCARLGVRLVVTAGLLALSAVMIGYSVLESLVGLYLLHALLGFAYACIHVVVLMIVLSRWFAVDDPRRGIALGICVAGASCGAVVMAQLIAALMAHMAWRSVFPVLACLPFALVPLVWLFVATPRDAQRGDWLISREGALGFSWTLFWRRSSAILMVALVPVFYVSACIASHAVLMLSDRGLPVTVTAAGVGLYFSCGLMGKFGSGFLLLRLSLERAWLLMAGCMLAGSAVLLIRPETQYMAGFALVGLGWGGCFPLAQLKIAKVYPGPALAQVLGLFVVFESFGSAAGAWATALLFDRLGGYQLPFLLNCILLAIGIAAAVIEPRMRVPQPD